MLSDISAFVANKDAEKRTVSRRKCFQSYWVFSFDEASFDYGVQVPVQQHFLILHDRELWGLLSSLSRSTLKEDCWISKVFSVFTTVTFLSVCWAQILSKVQCSTSISSAFCSHLCNLHLSSAVNRLHTEKEFNKSHRHTVKDFLAFLSYVNGL